MKNDSNFITIKIIAKDRNGLVYEISGILSQLNIAILHHEARVYNNKNKGMLSKSILDIRVDDENQLEILMHRLRKIKGIVSVN